MGGAEAREAEAVREAPFAVNVETGEVVAMEVTTDDTHDSQALRTLLEKAGEQGRLVRLYGDGAYDTSKAYELLEGEGVLGRSSSPAGTAGPTRPAPPGDER